MNACLDALCLQPPLQLVPRPAAHGVDVVDMECPRHLAWGYEVGAKQSRRVGRRVVATRPVPAVEVSQFDAQDGGLDLVKAVVVSPELVVVLALGAPVTKHAE